MLHIRLFIGVIAIMFFAATFEFIRSARLREEYAILWLFTSSIVAVLSLWPRLINIVSEITGLYYITAVLAIVFALVIAVLMHYSIAISKIKEMNKELTQKCALLELRVRQLENKYGWGDTPPKDRGREGRPPSRFIGENGAGNGARTRGIKLGKLALYQLSYARLWI